MSENPLHTETRDLPMLPSVVSVDLAIGNVPSKQGRHRRPRNDGGFRVSRSAKQLARVEAGQRSVRSMVPPQTLPHIPSIIAAGCRMAARTGKRGRSACVAWPLKGIRRNGLASIKWRVFPKTKGRLYEPTQKIYEGFCGGGGCAFA